MRPSPSAFNTLNSQTSVIVRVQGPLVRWNRAQHAQVSRAADAIDDGSRGKHLVSRGQSIFAILSRRGVRRYNVVGARAYDAIQCDGIASLLP